MYIATQMYPWTQHCQRDGRSLDECLDAVLRQVVESGIAGWEPSLASVDQVAPAAAALDAHGLEMRSFYAGGPLHTDEADTTIDRIVATGVAARAHGAQVVVVNPGASPDRDKNDHELEAQARSMDTLGRRLADEGLGLAYHTHDREMRAAAREFHHTMVATDPKYVSLGMDTHWIYRGAGNSQVALDDIVTLYGERIRLLHLRQSHGGVWAEMFEDGDIDYARLARFLRDKHLDVPLVLEMAIEQGTPQTVSHVDAYRRSREYAQRVFAPC